MVDCSSVEEIGLSVLPVSVGCSRAVLVVLCMSIVSLW